MENHENEIPQVYLLGKTYLTNNEKFYIRNDSIINMAAGDRHTIIVTESGRVFAFGDNNSGQLGLGHTNNIEKVSCIKSLKFSNTEEKVILAACGRESSLVATNRGSLYAFGLNNRCQLGIGSEESIVIHPNPIKIEYFRTRISWKQISMGAEHTCVLTNDGKVYIWGSNEHGQCGQARKYDIIRTPRELKLDYSVISISCGYYHTALISEDGRLFLFGNNADRQLGCSIPDQYIGPLEVSLSDPIKTVACGNQHTIVLTEKGKVYACGRGDRGQLGLGSRISIVEHFEIIKNLPKHLTAIATGEAHTAILGSRGEIYVFGDSKHGKLSYETHSNEFEPCSIDKFKGYNVLKVVCGGCQTIILAQKKSIEDIENTTNSKTKSIKNVTYINHTNTIDDSIDTSSQYTEPFEISNNKNYSKNLHINNQDFQPLKTDVLDHIVPLNNINQKTLSDKNTNKQSTLNKILTRNSHQQTLSDENNEYNNHQTSSSSTTSGRSSSSISSIHNENQIITSKSIDDLQNNFHSSATKTFTKSDITNSNIDSTEKTITNQSQPRFFSRIFRIKSSQKLSKNTNKNSRSCLIL